VVAVFPRQGHLEPQGAGVDAENGAVGVEEPEPVSLLGSVDGAEYRGAVVGREFLMAASASPVAAPISTSRTTACDQSSDL
jgi:hypothetical protein